ncbi:MAG: septum formation initiator family protein [Acidobacteria bacterium]|jgi:cell division protein FtsB|nr:septum formation initiator family protein [Acidobacteriota bacterium]
MPATGQSRLEENEASRKKEISLLQSRGLALLLVFFLFILVLAFVFGDRGIVEIVKTKKQIKALQMTIRALEAEKSKLTREIELLRENPLALEKKARESLWLMKKNEKVVVLPPEPKESIHE